MGSPLLKVRAAHLATLSDRIKTRREQMTGEQSRQLQVGDRVRWGQDKNDQGTVSEKSWSGVILKWDNRDRQSVLHNDMVQIEHVSVKD